MCGSAMLEICHSVSEFRCLVTDFASAILHTFGFYVGFLATVSDLGVLHMNRRIGRSRRETKQ